MTRVGIKSLVVTQPGNNVVFIFCVAGLKAVKFFPYEISFPSLGKFIPCQIIVHIQLVWFTCETDVTLGWLSKVSGSLLLIHMYHSDTENTVTHILVLLSGHLNGRGKGGREGTCAGQIWQNNAFPQRQCIFHYFSHLFLLVLVELKRVVTCVTLLSHSHEVCI